MYHEETHHDVLVVLVFSPGISSCLLAMACMCKVPCHRYLDCEFYDTLPELSRAFQRQLELSEAQP